MVLLISVEMSIFVGILTFISRINTTSDSFKASVKLSMKKFYYLDARCY